MPLIREGMINLADIQIDQDYLSRLKPLPHLIDEYVQDLTNGADLISREPIVVEEGTNKLFSGYHRVKAYQRYDKAYSARQATPGVGETLDLWPAAAGCRGTRRFF